MYFFMFFHGYHIKSEAIWPTEMFRASLLQLLGQERASLSRADCALQVVNLQAAQGELKLSGNGCYT